MLRKMKKQEIRKALEEAFEDCVDYKMEEEEMEEEEAQEECLELLKYREWYVEEE